MVQVGRPGRKLRGTRRRFRALRQWADQFVDWFPSLGSFHRGYLHWKLPVHRLFVEGRHVRRSTQRDVVEILLGICANLKANQPQTHVPIRVIAIVTLPQIFDADITIFLGSEHYDGFFNRNTDYQRWTPLPATRSLRKEWALSAANDLQEFGMSETIDDDDFHRRGELWFYGDVPNAT